MIDLLSDEYVKAFIEQRKQKFMPYFNFYVLTPKNHVFRFWSDGDVSILNQQYGLSFQPEIAKLYGAEYDSSEERTYIKNHTTCKHLYDLFINDPTCLFSCYWDEIQQELQNRGLR